MKWFLWLFHKLTVKATSVVVHHGIDGRVIASSRGKVISISYFQLSTAPSYVDGQRFLGVYIMSASIHVCVIVLIPMVHG